MLTHPTIDKLHQLRCPGMAAALAEQLHSPLCDALSFEERLGLLADRELTRRDDRRMSSRLRRAKLRHPNACIEDIDYRHPRRLDKALIHSLASGRWLRERLNVLITGPTGVGKSWLACALAHHACRDGFSALYLRIPRLLHDLANRSRRRPIPQAPRRLRQNRPPRPRRLRTRHAQPRQPPRPPRTPRRPIRLALHTRHQPAPPGPMA